MRKIADLWRLRARTSNSDLPRVASGHACAGPHPPRVAEPFVIPDSDADDLTVAQAGLNAIARGRAKMSRDLMLAVLDVAGMGVGPFTPDDYDPQDRYWDSWLPFAEPEWIDILLDILAKPSEGLLDPTPEASTYNFGLHNFWNDFQLFFWDVAEFFPQDALTKLELFLAHPNEMQRKIARELAEDIELQAAHTKRLQDDAHDRDA